MLFSWLIFPFILNFNSLLLQLQFFLFPLLNKHIFSREYAIVSPPLRRLFCFGFAFSSSSFRCLFCVLPKLSRALFLISIAFALSTFFLSFSTVSSAATSFSAISSRAFSTSLKSHSIPLAFSSSFILALNFSLSSVYLSLTARLLTLNRGSSRPFRLFAIFPRSGL